MTPVATPVALQATSWDTALALRTAADPACAWSVHSVHTRVLNIRYRNTLIALADDSLDDAPATIRVPITDWTAHGIRIGDEVLLFSDRIEIPTALGAIDIALTGAQQWNPAPLTVQAVPADVLLHAHAQLERFHAPLPLTPFGRVSAIFLSSALDQLRGAATVCLRAAEPREDAEKAVTAAALRLLGLGEGLTPVGDDILTGLALVAAHEAFGLAALSGPLQASLSDAVERTTLLSVVTLRAAVTGRGRGRLHDLITAIAADEPTNLTDAAARTAEIGHTSGHDILTGIRLALELAITTHPINQPSEGDH